MSGGSGRERGDVAICVLGCRSNSAALARRTDAGFEAFSRGRGSLIVACGGVTWFGTLEADAIADTLEARGVPAAAIVRERSSRDTHENALFTAELLREKDRREVLLVTCSWHLPRARRLFTRAGLQVVGGVGVPPPDAGVTRRSYWAARERVAAVKDAVRLRLVRR